MKAVISIAPYLTDKCEHTALYKINSNVYIKTSNLYRGEITVRNHVLRSCATCDN